MALLWVFLAVHNAFAASLDLPPYDPNSLNRFFDGTPVRPIPDDKNWVHDMDVRNGQLARFSAVYVPWGVEVQGGYLGLSSSRSDLVGLSPYVNVIKRVESKPDSRLDYRVQAQLGILDLTASYFDKTSPAQSPQTDAFLQSFTTLAGKLGLNDKDAQKIMGYASYQDNPRTTQMALGSVLAEVGRAYSLYGPVDMAWAAGGLVKFSYLFPSANFDLSGGPRVNLGGGRSLSFYGGVTESPSFFGTHATDMIFAQNNPQFGLQWMPAPHAAVGYLGPMPYAEDTQLQLGAERQWNSETKADQYRAGLQTEVLGKPVDVYGAWRHEYGPAIEYDRLQELVGLTVHLSQQLSASAGWQTEHIHFGDARVDNDSVQAGITWKWGGTGNKKVTITEQSGGRDRLVSEAPSGDWTVAAGNLNAAVSQALAAADSAQNIVALLNADWPQARPQIIAGIQQLADTLRKIDPQTKQALISEIVAFGKLNQAQTQVLQDLLGGVNPQQLADELSQVQVPTNLPPIQIPIDLTPLTQHLDDVRNLLSLFSNEAVLDGVAIRFGRAQAIQALEGISQPIPQLGTTLRLTPAVLLAGVQIIQNRPSTLAPVTQADVTQVLEPWVWKSAAQALGMSGTSTPDQISTELLSRLTASAKTAILDRIDQNFYQRLSSLNAPQAAQQLLSYLPVNLQTSLKAQYGADLSGLVGAALSSKQAVDKVVAAAVDQAIASTLGPDLKTAANAAAAWAAKLMRTELNRDLLNMILAAEQLNELNVDRGERLSTLQNGFLDFTQERLAQRRERAQGILRGARGFLTDRKT